MAQRGRRIRNLPLIVRSVKPSASELLAFLVSIATLGTSLVTALFFFWDYHSKTSLIVTDLDADAISCYVWNTGRRPSRLIRSVLTFGPFAYKNAALNVADPKTSVIPPAGSASATGVTLQLRFGRLKRRCTERVTGAIALYVEIVESNSSHNIQRVPFSEDAIKRLIENKREEVDPCK